MLPREGSAPGAPGPPKLPLDEPFVAYSLDDLAADACFFLLPHKMHRNNIHHFFLWLDSIIEQ